MNVEISGNLRGPTVIFLAGWPDSSDVFRTNLIAHLRKDYRIVGITMPGYTDDSAFMKTYCEQFREARKAKARSEEQRKQRSGRKKSRCWSVKRGVRFAFHSVKQLLGGGNNRSANAGATWEDEEDSELDNTASMDLVRYQLENDDEPMRTPLFGHGFQDLVRLLEIAIDSAMEMHNECPSAFLATSFVDANKNVQGIPAHQLPPYYPRPAIVAHGWGVQLVFELLLSRPTFFSRIIALDAGAAVFASSHWARAGTQRGAVTAIDGGGGGFKTVVTPPSQPASQHGDGSFPGSPAAGAAPAASPLTMTQPYDRFDRRHGHTSPTTMSKGEETIVRPYSKNGNVSEGTYRRPVALRGTAPQPSTCSAAVVPPEQVYVEPDMDGLERLVDGEAQHVRREGVSTYAQQHRSLASRYAIRPRKTNAVKTTNVRNLWQRLSIFLFQLLIIACTFTMPRFIARWVLLGILWVAGRPRYGMNPRVLITPENEAFNQKLYQQYRFHASLIHDSCEDVPLHLQRKRSHLSFNAKYSNLREGSNLCDSSDHEEKYTLFQSDDFNTHNVNSHSTSFGPQPFSGRGGGVFKGFRVPSTGDWHIVLIPFLRKPTNLLSASGEAAPTLSAMKHSFSPSSFSADGRDVQSWHRGHGLKDSARNGDFNGPVCLGDSGEYRGWPSNRAAFATNAAGEPRLSGRALSHARGKGSTTTVESNNTIDIGFAKADGVSRWGVVQENSLESMTAVSPYHAYRHAKNTVYDCALPSGAMHPSPDTNSNGIVDSPDNTWLPEDPAGSPSLRSRQYMQWRRKEVYYRSFVIPPPPEHSCVDDDIDLNSLCARNTRKGGEGREQATDVQPTMGWIYLQYWWGVVLSILFSPSAERRGAEKQNLRVSTAGRQGGAGHQEKEIDSNSNQVAGAYSPLVSQRFYFPVHVPVLYMYGGSKPFMLHSAQWCDYITHVKHAEDGISDVVEIQGGGHWFFAEKRYQKKVAERVAEFIVAKTT